MTPEKREQFLSDNVERLLNGITYHVFWRGGRSQATLNEDATEALTKLRVLIEVERDGGWD